jgi:hypothetical protein
MSPLLAVYLLVSLLCGIDSIVDVERTEGSQQFPPPQASVFPPAFEGVCGVCVNHSVSYVQHTTPLVVVCREGSVCAKAASSGLLPFIVVPVKSGPLGVLPFVYSLGMKGGLSAATNLCLCARSLPPPLLYRCGLLSSMGRGSISLSLILLLRDMCLCCACTLTSYSCTHHITNTTNTAGRHILMMVWVEAGFSPFLSALESL